MFFRAWVEFRAVSFVPGKSRIIDIDKGFRKSNALQKGHIVFLAGVGLY